MSITDLRQGDMVNWRHHSAGVVVRLGPGTVWAEFPTPHGLLRQACPRDEVRRHAARHEVIVGAYLLRTPGHGPGSLQIHHLPSGEMLELQEAQLESLLDRLWRRAF